MSGILDSKQRILDAIVTQEGRNQMATGDMRIEYVSFTDTGTYYSEDLVSGSSDATSRIFLEACNLPQDSITFEADDSGRLQPFNNEDGIVVKDGQIVSYSFDELTGSVVTGSLERASILNGDEFASQASRLLASSLNNFNKLHVIGSHDRIFDDDEFALGPNFVEYVITENRPISNPNLYVAHTDHVDSLFNDVRLSNVTNFKFLPPVNKIIDESIDKTDYRETSKFHLGNYRPWGRTHINALTYEQVKHELAYYEQIGYSRTITFDPTSRDNRLVVQFFEKGFDQLKKLDVIDFGKHRTNNQGAPISHIFFVGKVISDDNDTHTFVHLFTMIFE